MNMEMFIDKLKNKGCEPVQSGTAGVYTFRHKAGNYIVGVIRCTGMDVIPDTNLNPCAVIFPLYTAPRMFFL